MRHVLMAVFCCLGLFLAGQAFAAEAGTVIEKTTLYASPGEAPSGTVAKGALVTIDEREGAWYAITSSDGRKGYVRISTVRFKEQAEESSVFGGLWSWLNSSRSTTYGNTTTAGIRGMSESDIINAKVDSTFSVEDLDSLAVTEKDARSYAAQLSLKSRDLDDLK